MSAGLIVGELVWRRVGCRRIGLSASWSVGELVVGELDCRRVGLSASWSVGELVCRLAVQLPIITPLTRVDFVYNGPKGMELAPNPHYSGGS